VAKETVVAEALVLPRTSRQSAAMTDPETDTLPSIRATLTEYASLGQRISRKNVSAHPNGYALGMSDTQTHDTEDMTVVKPGGNPDERTSPPVNPDVDETRVKINEEDAERTIPK
jgi:hypothetical protein